MLLIILFTSLLLLFQLAAYKMKTKANKVIEACSIIILISISAIISFRTGVAVHSSDIIVYQNYVGCVNYNMSLVDCNSFIGASSSDIVLFGIVKVLSLFNLGSQSVFFVCSLIISMSFFCFYKRLTTLLPLALFLVLVDSNYWELTANILRQSLAISFFLFLIAMPRYNSFLLKILAFTLIVLCISSHPIGIVYLVCYFVSFYISLRNAIIFFILSLFLGYGLLPYLASLLTDFNSFAIVKKIQGYSSIESKSDFFSIFGKLNVVILAAICFLNRRISSSFFLRSITFLLLLLSVGAIFVSTPLIYRILNIVPFLMILLLLYLVKSNVKNSKLLLLIYLLWNFTFDIINYQNSMRFIVNEV
ncbi:EpsG family protein [Pseudoalteromonas sp. SMN1298-MNA-CIBAN-0114]|uniref:EpsG family protein n=1 Tax=Pseudoalteromonas sp. SMN1298-MNA-CIBAN-0114 TaxID=3140428 RepID=UPI003325755B